MYFGQLSTFSLFFKTSTSSLCHTAVAPLPLDETPLDYTVIYKGTLRQQSREHDSLISSSGMGILGKIVRNCYLGPPGSTSPNVGQQRVHVSMRSAHVLGTRLGSSALGARPRLRPEPDERRWFSKRNKTMYQLRTVVLTLVFYRVQYTFLPRLNF